MPENIGIVLLLICLFEVKHMFADFYLQTKKMLSGRCQYFHPGRAQHAGVHALASVVVLFIVGSPPWFIALICAAEWLIHFNIDFWKAHHTECHKLDPTQGAFWRAMGTDQLLHHLTYVGMTAAWASVVF